MIPKIAAERELLNLINNFIKVAGYKTNSKKSVAFIYSKDKQAEKEITEMTHLMKVIRNIKYLGSDSNQASERSV